MTIRRTLLRAAFTFAALLTLSGPLPVAHGASAAHQESTYPYTFTDLAAQRVTIEKKPERFALAYYVPNFLMVGGDAALARVVGLSKDGWGAVRVGEEKLFTRAYPALSALPSIGSYHDDTLATERILALKPDVLIISKMQYAANAARLPIFERAGIKVVALDYHSMQPERHQASTEILGRLLEREATAAALNARAATVLETIRNRIAALPAAERGRATYVELGNQGVAHYGNTYNGEILWGGILKFLDAGNIATGMKTPYGAVTREFVLAANPKTIIIAGSIWDNKHASDQMRMGMTVSESEAQARLAGFAARPLWERLDAVKNGELYAVDHGSLRNAFDYTSVMFLAKVLYPKTFADFDPAGELRALYARYLPAIKLEGTFFLKLKAPTAHNAAAERAQ